MLAPLERLGAVFGRFGTVLKRACKFTRLGSRSGGGLFGPRRRPRRLPGRCGAAVAPHLGAKDGQQLGPRGPKKGPEGLERRLGSELDLTVYQIYVSVDIHTLRSTK